MAAHNSPGRAPGGPRRSQRDLRIRPNQPATSVGGWITNQPYLLLSITALCWAGNAIVGRLAAGHIPPVTLSFLRWALAFLIILPFAWTHLRAGLGRDPRHISA